MSLSRIGEHESDAFGDMSMNVNIVIRDLRPDEFEWANACYAEVGFRPSSPDQEIIVADVQGADGKPTRAGIGRLVPVAGEAAGDAGQSTAELSGIYVVPAYRGQGVAARIVDALVQRSTHQLLYCIPLTHLEPLYSRYGFTPVEAGHDIPCALTTKLGVCNRDFAPTIRLFLRKRP